MKKPNNDIFLLIKSLSKKEKDFFKRYVYLITEKRQNHYTILFDAIVKQKNYNEIVLKKKLKKEIKFFAVVKNELHSNLLKSLELYHEKKMPKNQVRSLLNISEVLLSKGLGRIERSVINKAEKILDDDENFYLIPILNKRMNAFFSNLALDKDKENEENKVYEKLIKATESFIQETHYLWLHLKMLKRHIEYGTHRDDVGIQELKKIVNDPLMTSQPAKASFIGRYYYDNTWGLYHLTMDEYKEASVYVTKIVYDFENHKSRKNSYLHFIALSNAIITYEYLNEFQKTKYYLDRMEKMCDEGIDYRRQGGNFSFYYKNRLVNEIQMSSIYNAELIKKLSKKIELLKANTSIRDQMEVELSAAYYCFCFGKNSDSLLFLNNILNTRKGKLNVSTYSLAMLLNILTHFEMRNYDSVLSLIKSLRHYISAHPGNADLTNCTLSFLEKNIGLVEYSKSWVKKIEVYKFELIEIEKKLGEKVGNVLTTVDLISWAQSKIENCTLAEVLRRKTEKLLGGLK